MSGGTLIWLVVLIPGVLVFVAGVLLVFFALRGGLVSKGPHCRGCRFDLTGLPLEGESPVCPECGRGLKKAGAVRSGLRRKRPVMGVAGALLILVPVGAIGIAVVSTIRPSVHAYKPDFWLMLEVRSANPGALKPQLAELLARMQDRSLSTGNSAALIERALEVQADDTGAWDTAWGNILDFAAASSLLSDGQLQQNLRKAPRWGVRIRPTIVDGDNWVISLGLGPSRVGDAPVGRSPPTFKPAPVAIRIGDQTIDLPTRDPASIGIHWGGSSTVLLGSKVPGIQPGTHEFTIIWSFGVAPAFDKPAMVNWTEETAATITILPAGSTGIELLDKPDARDAILKSLTLGEPLRIVHTNDPSTPPNIGFSIRCNDPPIHLAFDLFVRERLQDAALGATPREWKIGSVTFSAGGSHNYGGGMDAPGFDAGAVDLILRPSPEAAKQTLDMNKIWNGGARFQSVPLSVSNAKVPLGGSSAPNNNLPNAEPLE